MKQIFTVFFLAIAILASAQNKTNKSAASRYEVDTIPLVYDLIGQVDTGQFMPVVRQLSSYTTRKCTTQQAIMAQNWLKDQFDSLGIQVELQDFPLYGGGSSSDNVIATLPGYVHPDEYVVVGGHYDSYTYSGLAPGADDNASGTSGVMELARILKNYSFERSIVFCAFSAEELGLIGSEYYATKAKQSGMNILGYFNFDMIGYLNPGDEIHTDMIAPSSAQELVDFYTNVAAVYLPDFSVEEAEPIGGDSDHTSFNNHGYMGIFPFEDTPNYSPYIHTPNDVIGLSFNSPEMAKKFIQANLASVATLAVPYDSTVSIPPTREITHNIVLFPNPVRDLVSISNDKGEPMLVSINNISGQTLLKMNVNGQKTIDLSSLKPGLYCIVCTGDDFTETLKMVKR